MSNIVTYNNGNYQINLDLDTGTKIRYTPQDHFDAAFPESMDIKVTNCCDKGCVYCHECSSKDGLHSEFPQPFLDSLHPYEEIAVGGGNVLTWPHLDEFLEFLKDKKCVPSITVNQDHFLDNVARIQELRKKELVYGIGVSLTKPTIDLVRTMQQFPTAVLHTIAGILDFKDVINLADQHLKILILGYKQIGRGARYSKYFTPRIKRNIESIGDMLMYMFNHFDTVSFDNLALKQLPVREVIGEDLWAKNYMGDDGQFTFYIDMVKKEYALSSTSVIRFPIGNKTIDEMFQHIKKIAGEHNVYYS